MRARFDEQRRINYWRYGVRLQGKTLLARGGGR